MKWANIVTAMRTTETKTNDLQQRPKTEEEHAKKVGLLKAVLSFSGGFSSSEVTRLRLCRLKACDVTTLPSFF